jgi:hypothetical protein
LGWRLLPLVSVLAAARGFLGRVLGGLAASRSGSPALGSGGEAGFRFFGQGGDLFLPAGFGDGAGSFGLLRSARGFRESTSWCAFSS